MILICERLICELCGIEFVGRKPIDNVGIKCPQCMMNDPLPLLSPIDDATYSLEVIAEFSNGKGDDTE